VPQRRAISKALLFSAGLLVLIPLFLVLWGFVLPYYAEALGETTLPLMRLCSGMSIDSVDVVPDGQFNTQTRLRYNIAGRTPELNVGRLVFNVPPFIALMAITPGLRWRRRVKALLIGTAILFAGHVLFLLLAFVFSNRIAHAPELPTALAELFLTLPFLLWIVLGYWDKLAAYLAPPPEATPQT
jgi:hypothetical protein